MSDALNLLKVTVIRLTVNIFICYEIKEKLYSQKYINQERSI